MICSRQHLSDVLVARDWRKALNKRRPEFLLSSFSRISIDKKYLSNEQTLPTSQRQPSNMPSTFEWISTSIVITLGFSLASILAHQTVRYYYSRKYPVINKRYFEFVIWQACLCINFCTVQVTCTLFEVLYYPGLSSTIFGIFSEVFSTHDYFACFFQRGAYCTVHTAWIYHLHSWIIND